MGGLAKSFGKEKRNRSSYANIPQKKVGVGRKPSAN